MKERYQPILIKILANITRRLDKLLFRLNKFSTKSGALNSLYIQHKRTSASDSKEVYTIHAYKLLDKRDKLLQIRG